MCSSKQPLELVHFPGTSVYRHFGKKRQFYYNTIWILKSSSVLALWQSNRPYCPHFIKQEQGCREEQGLGLQHIGKDRPIQHISLSVSWWGTKIALWFIIVVRMLPGTCVTWAPNLHLCSRTKNPKVLGLKSSPVCLSTLNFSSSIWKTGVDSPL